jgi:hypothetical protein
MTILVAPARDCTFWLSNRRSARSGKHNINKFRRDKEFTAVRACRFWIFEATGGILRHRGDIR